MRLFLLAAWLALGAVAAHADNLSPAGFWQHPTNGSVVETYPCGAGVWETALCMRIITVSDAQTSDTMNPDKDLRRRDITGLMILAGAEPTAPLKWKGGLYNRGDGKTYAVKITVKPGTLDVTEPCAFGTCRTVAWKRLENFKLPFGLGPPPPLSPPVVHEKKIEPRPAAVAKPAPPPQPMFPPARRMPSHPAPVIVTGDAAKCKPLKKAVCELTAGCAWAKGTAEHHGQCAAIKR
ncbi:MAG: DUF2147 domain-containing protein [Hyphomicrobiaceae bacterium]